MIAVSTVGTAQSSVLSLEMLASRAAWVIHGPEIVLDICIRTAPSRSSSMSTFLDHAVELLRNARVS
jgi:hypothetical protein